MKLKSFLAFLIIFILFSTAQNAYALSCVPAFPLVGIVSNISLEEPYAEILLDKFYTFDTSDFKNDIINIDQYENVAKEYIVNNFQLAEKPKLEYHGWENWINRISPPLEPVYQTKIKNGDIIINGPPFHVCSYRFTGLFTDDGKLRSAIINDNYADYSYRGYKLIVEKGRELECDNYRCKIEVNFNLNGESFKLSPGQSYKPKTGLIKSIYVFDSSDLKKTIFGPTIYDWGTSTYATYLIDFSDSDIPISTPIEEPKMDLLGSVKNFFQKIWSWFILVFA